MFPEGMSMWEKWYVTSEGVVDVFVTRSALAPAYMSYMKAVVRELRVAFKHVRVVSDARNRELPAHVVRLHNDIGSNASRAHIRLLGGTYSTLLLLFAPNGLSAATSLSDAIRRLNVYVNVRMYCIEKHESVSEWSLYVARDIVAEKLQFCVNGTQVPYTVAVVDVDDTLIDENNQLMVTVDTLKCVLSSFDFVAVWTHGTHEHIAALCRAVPSFGAFCAIADMIDARPAAEPERADDNKGFARVLRYLNATYGVTVCSHRWLIDNDPRNDVGDYSQRLTPSPTLSVAQRSALIREALRSLPRAIRSHHGHVAR